MLRKLLVGSAQYILGPFGPDTDLRRYGLRLCERGGKNAKKKAAVAVGRKLAVLLHCLWSSAGQRWEEIVHTRQLAPTTIGLSGKVAFRPIVTVLRWEENVSENASNSRAV
jgi:hypothetical protein